MSDERPAADRLWRNRDFVFWWCGNLASTVGSAMSLVAYPLLVLAITGSPLQTAAVAGVEAAPYAVLSLVAGVFVDRLPRRVLLVGASFASMLATATIPVTHALGSLSVAQILLVALVNGIAGVVFSVAGVAVLPQIVPVRHLGPAAGQAELIWNVSAIVGPPLAGLLIVRSPVLPFVVDAASFGLVGLAVLAIQVSLDAQGEPEPLNWRLDLTVGARRVLTQRRLRALTLVTIVGDLLFAGVAVLMTVLIKSRGGGSIGVGTIFAMAAIGGVVGSLLAARIENRLGLVRSVLVRSWVTAALFPLLALDVVPLAIGLVWSVINIMIAVMNVVQMRYIMTSIPENMLGRVQSFMTFLGYAVLPVGTLLTGVSLQAWGPRGTVLLFTAVLVVLAAYATVSRDLRAPDGAASPTTGAEPGLRSAAGGGRDD